MLRNVSQSKIKSNASFVIVAARYNSEYVDALVHAAREELLAAGATVRIIRVPGAFEIPAVASKLAEKASRKLKGAARPSAILCFGVVFQGETPHAQHISWGVTHALAQIQVLHRIPVIHGVFLFEKEKHARVRCLGQKHNRGTEAAQTALQMAQVMARL
jgi:6,7-dimethyl-8-ribityllumazine synthase